MMKYIIAILVAVQLYFTLQGLQKRSEKRVDYAALCWKRKTIILLSVVVFFNLGIVINFMYLPTVYSAASTVIVDSPAPVVVEGEKLEKARKFFGVETQVKLLRSRMLAKRVVKELGYPSGRVKELRDFIKVRPSEKDSLIYIIYEGANPKECADIANAYAKVFKETSEEIADNVKVTILDKALVPKLPIRPNRFKNMFIISILGLFTGIGIVFIIEEMEQRSEKEKDPYRPRIRYG